MNRIGVKDLLIRLDEAGLPSSRGWLLNMLKSGKIVLPRVKYTTAVRYDLTEDVIAQLIEDLKKKGSYIYKEAKNI